MHDNATVHMTIPLFIRLLEFAREDAQSDLDLHFVAENILKLQWKGDLLDMKDYKRIVLEE